MSNKMRKPGPGGSGRAPEPGPQEGMPLRRLASLAILGLIGAGFIIAAVAIWLGPPAPAPVVEKARSKTAEAPDGMHRVIVTLKDLQAGEAAKGQIAAAQDRLLKELGTQGVRLERRYELLPQLTLSVNDAVLALLKTHPLVARVDKDEVNRPLEGVSAPPK